MIDRQEDTPLNPVFTALGHRGVVSSVVWLSDDRIVTGSSDHTMRIWNVMNSKQEGHSMLHQGPLVGIVASKDGRIISCSAQDDHMTVWNGDTQRLVNQPWSILDYGPVYCIALSPTTKLLVSCHQHWIVFWEMAVMIRVRNHINFQSIEEPTGIEACFSPDSNRLAACYGRKTVVVFDVERRERLFGPVEAESSWFGILAIIWSPSGDQLLCGCGDGSIRVWNPSTGEVLGEPWTGHQRRVECVSLSHDGKWLASGSSDRRVLLWDMESNDAVGEPLDHGASVRAVAFSSSGEFVACSGDGGRISVWRVPWWKDDAGEVLHPLLDLSAVVSPDVPSNISRELDPDFVNMRASVSRRRLPRDRPTENTFSDPAQVQSPLLRWKWWKRIPRLVLDRSNTIYTGLALPRVYVASSDTPRHSPRSRPQQVSEAPEYNAGFTTTVETDSEDSSDSNSTDTSQDDVEGGRIGCCGLLSHRQPTPVGHSAPTNRLVPNSTVIATSVPPSTRPTPAPQDILELSAVVRSNDIP